MKSLLLAFAITLGGIAAPIQAQTTAPAVNSAEINAAKKKVGGLKVGKKFKFKIKEAIGAKTEGFGEGTEISTKKLPKGMPRFKTGQKVPFKIGKKGELRGPGLSIPLLDSSSPVINTYSNSQSKNFDPTFMITANASKDSEGNIIGIIIDVTKIEVKGFATVTYKAIYSMGEGIE